MLRLALGLLLLGSAVQADSVMVCRFDRLPVMLFHFVSADFGTEGTVQIGKRDPVPLSIGSSLMMASLGAQEFVFSLRIPATVTVTAPGNNDQTFYGNCESSASNL